MTDADFKNPQEDVYANQRIWHGLSCCCGGGYRVGHPLGCQWANKESNLVQLNTDLEHAKDNDDVDEVIALERIKEELERLPE